MFSFKSANSNCRFSANKGDSELKSCNMVQPKSLQGLPDFVSDLKVFLRFQCTIWQGADETDLEILFPFGLSDFSVPLIDKLSMVLCYETVSVFLYCVV